MTPLPNRFPILRAVATGALALLVAMLVLVHPASAEGVAASCATGRAVEDAANNLGLVSDCDALLVARDTLAGTATLNWSVDIPISYWEGVLLAGLPLRVTELLLEWEELPSGTRRGRVIPLGNQLTGEIPPELGSLANLQHLDLSSNRLSGEIPPELGNLADLGHLDLNGNELSGEIPPELGSLTNLYYLSLSHNRLSSGISAELGSLANLQRLFLTGNQLSGGIPSELGSIANLDVLALSLNQLSGEIPSELGNLANLDWLNLSDNQLSGEIPSELGNLANLDWLDLKGNRLSGEIPPELGSFAYLEWMKLSDNQLSGEIPSELGSLTNLGWLDLSDNQLGGEIPSGLGSLTDLVELNLSGNELTGEIPSGLDSLKNLGRLDLSGNELTGEIPTELGRLANLYRLYLSDNRLSGEIPMELGSLTNLKSLDLAGNRLSGEIPAELGGLTNLKSLDFSYNQLSGAIPPELGSLSNLWELDLSGNQLSGCIPEELRDVASNDLEDLDLPFCDVLLSGLAISPGTLTPPFDSYHTDYTTVVGQSRVTVTPTNDHNASFQFLDEYNGEIADADGSLVGHQIDLGAGVTTVRIRVISPDSRATHTYTIVDRTEEIPPCTPVPGSPIDPCEPDVALISGHGFEDIGSEPWSVRFYLDDSRGRILVPHLVVRGTYIPGTVRCIADNTARYPSYIGVPNNSVPGGVSQFKCYADVRVNAYVVGSGPSTLTVLVWPFGYWSNATPEAIERLRSYYERFFIEGWDGYVITVPAGGIGGREAMLFLGPPIDVSIESWRVYTTWDVQRREDGTVVAVHPHRDHWRSRADYQTYRSAVEMELPVFTQAATAAHQARLTEYGGRIGLEENLPMLVSDANQLRRYYNEVGAYSHPEGPPSQPPPVYAPAPASLTATASGETTELGEESAGLSWSSVTGASGYHVQRRISGAGERWFTVDESVTGTTHTASGLWCGRTHEFRVGAHGDGTTYNARAGLWSPTATATTAACSPLPPRFRADSYSLDVSAAGISVSDGVVSAFDLNDDAVTYSITAGDEAGKFRIDSSTGEITTTGPPGSPVGTTYTLTVGAADGVSGTTTVTVTVTVVVITCSGGIVVPYPGIESGLVSDCEVLLGLRDTLAGSATLNWSVDSPIADWEGVNLAGSPLRVTRLALERLGLTGVVPPELGELTGLKELLLGRNGLTGEIPPELGDLVNLGKLDLSDNQLSGEIPSELGSLANLQRLYLSLNELSGEIPSELGSLANLRRLYLSRNQLSGEIPMELGSLSNLQRLLLSDNQLSGCIPEGLRDVASNDLEDLDLPFCASRSIREDAAEGSNVGNPVVATDDGEGDTLTYTLGGADADSFDIDSNTGQITVGDGTQLDYETKDRYDVTVTATDPSSGASDTTTVTIMVTDVRVSEDAAVNAYDANTNETIEKSEVIDAILDYLNYEIEKGLVLDLIGLYFAPTLPPTSAPELSYRTAAEIPPCTPIQGSSVDPCEPDVAQVSSNGGIINIGPEPWSVRSFLDGGRGSLLEGHLVVRGTYIPGTVRCIADNTARYQSYIGVPNKSFPDGVSAFKCYADVRVNAYVVGSGPSTLTVLVRAFRYWSNATPEAIERLRSNYERFFIEGGDAYGITAPADGIGGREAILYLGPAIDVSIESWRVYTTSDVQRREDGTIVVVHPDRDAWRTLSPTDYQTYRSTLEMELPAFTQAATAAHQARLIEYGGRIGPEENLPMLVSDANQLRRFYNDVGAYGYPEGPPAQPPPVYAPASASLTATASGEATALGEESADLSWSSVTGASGYHVQHRISGTGERWSTVDGSVTGTTHTASGLWCGRTHKFRVGAHGDGTTYNARAGLWSPTATATTAACSPLPPRFRADSYSFEISALASVGDTVGAVSAFDVNDDTVSYSITAGNDDGKFAIASSTGEITVAASLSGAGDTRTLTVGAGDGVSGTTSVTVTIRLTATCSDGIAVSDAANNPGLVSDCETLLVARDTLAGSATLNWSVNSPIADWEGVILAGSPLRVTELRLHWAVLIGGLALFPEGVILSSNQLTGEIPPELGSLAYLEVLHLTYHQLSGEIPPELGSLTNLKSLHLRGNELSGEIPSELGSLTNLKSLDLAGNRLSGEIPSELGSLANLRELYLSGNQLSGEVPPELGSLVNLRELYLPVNQLSGEIPSELGSLAKLGELDLRSNKLGGEIPPELGSLVKLYKLWLSGNQLSGEIPSELGSLAKLGELDLRGKRVERGDTAGTGQPRQPGLAGTSRATG